MMIDSGQTIPLSDIGRFYKLFKFRMLPNGKKSNALRAEILGPCGGNLKEEIFP